MIALQPRLRPSGPAGYTIRPRPANARLRPALRPDGPIEARTRLAEVLALEMADRTAYATAIAGPDPAAARAARDRLSGIEVAVAQLHGSAALAERRLRAARPEESAHG